MNIARIIAAGSLAVGLAGIASAQVNNPGAPYDLYFSGSTAYRTQVVNAEIATLSAGLTTANGYAAGTQPGEGYNSSAAFSVANLQGQSISVIHGVDANNNEIIIHNHFTGSTAGCVDVATDNTTVTYIPDSSTPAINGTAVGLAASTTAAPEVAMSDCLYSDAATVLGSSGDNTAGKNAGIAVGNSGMVEGGVNAAAVGYVGSVDFEWVLGSVAASAPQADITNITQDNAAALLSLGFMPETYLTGNTADSAGVVVVIGRNEDSGTRVLYQSESWANGTGNKFGLGAATVQWLVTQSGVALPTSSGYSSLSGDASGITAIQKWPKYNYNGSNYTTASAGGWSLYTESTITWATLGHSGYNSGGDVAAILESPNPVTGITGTPSGFTNLYIVTCIGAHDAAAALTNASGPNAKALTYNGVAYSKANIENGSYALWNFEHLYYLTGSQANSFATVANGAAIQATADAVAEALYNGTFGTSSTDVGIAGNLVQNYPAMAARSQSGGAYLQ